MLFHSCAVSNFFSAKITQPNYYLLKTERALYPMCYGETYTGEQDHKLHSYLQGCLRKKPSTQFRLKLWQVKGFIKTITKIGLL